MNSVPLQNQPWRHNLYQLGNRTPTILYLLPISPLSFNTSRNFTFRPLKSFKPIHFSISDPPEYEEEEAPLGDCIVFEEGIFDDPFLSSTGNLGYGDVQSNAKKKNIELEPENLIPEDWIEIQRELNITKKERRKLSQQLDYGRKVEQKRQGLMPINSEVYEQIKNEKLQQLRPVVLDNPDLKHLEDKNDGSNDRRDDSSGNEEEILGRVAPKNPRLAVYGRGLEDISELFNSGGYIPGASNKPEGPRKLFSKEEKTLLNRRVPDLAVATSGKWHPLHTLAAAGEFYLVNSLLKHNIDINVPDKEGLTAIHRAILSKKQAIFNFLLRESINPFVRDKVGATLLHYAVFAASSQMIKILLLYNVDINLQDNDGWTPLHLAVHSRRTDIVKLLLIKGADKTLTNRDRLTPLDLCLYSGRDTRTYELIKLMKQYPKSS